MRYFAKITTTFALALVFSAGMAFGQDNSSSVDQTGSDHEATVTQTGESNNSIISQSDDAGQFGRSPGNFATATISQTGDANFSKVEQTSFFGNGEVAITQAGDENSARLRQTNGGGTAEIYMNGDENILGGWRRINGPSGNNGVANNAPATQKNDNLFDLDVEGNNNRVGLRQESAQSATVSLNGDGNRVPIFQKDPGSTISITANGSDNVLEVFQGPKGGFGAGPGGNSATIDVISGDLNNVRVSQTAANNTASVTVDGSGNSATVRQQAGGGMQ